MAPPSPPPGGARGGRGRGSRHGGRGREGGAGAAPPAPAPPQHPTTGGAAGDLGGRGGPGGAPLHRHRGCGGGAEPRHRRRSAAGSRSGGAGAAGGAPRPPPVLRPDPAPGPAAFDLPAPRPPRLAGLRLRLPAAVPAQDERGTPRAWTAPRPRTPTGPRAPAHRGGRPCGSRAGTLHRLVPPDVTFDLRQEGGAPGGDGPPQTLLLFLFLRHEDPFQQYDAAARRLLLTHLAQTLRASSPALARGLRALVHPVLGELRRCYESHQRLASSLPVVVAAVAAVVAGSTNARFRRRCLSVMKVEDTPALAVATRRSLARVTRRWPRACGTPPRRGSEGPREEEEEEEGGGQTGGGGDGGGGTGGDTPPQH
ncbi:type 2 DNA topoisomerase 6 subunit B-like [Athene noctua]|uniref:type 2 DNA topoisomerase 6 subunit B-like n=1 Tax=Athene noctua TaxID=126797 RepID=UPI003EB7555C